MTGGDANSLRDKQFFGPKITGYCVVCGVWDKISAFCDVCRRLNSVNHTVPKTITFLSQIGRDSECAITDMVLTHVGIK